MFGDLLAFVSAQAAAIKEHAIAKTARKHTATAGAALFAGVTAILIFSCESFID